MNRCNVQIGNDPYYANEEDKYTIIKERYDIAITAIVIGLLSLIYTLKQAYTQQSIFILLPFSSGLLCVILGSIQLNNYMEAVNNVKGYGKYCQRS